MEVSVRMTSSTSGVNQMMMSWFLSLSSLWRLKTRSRFTHFFTCGPSSFPYFDFVFCFFLNSVIKITHTVRNWKTPIQQVETSWNSRLCNWDKTARGVCVCVCQINNSTSEPINNSPPVLTKRSERLSDKQTPAPLASAESAQCHHMTSSGQSRSADKRTEEKKWIRVRCTTSETQEHAGKPHHRKISDHHGNTVLCGNPD